MKKTFFLILAMVMMTGILTACGAKKTEHAEYTVYNTTGANLAELYMYDAGSSKKGDNLAGKGLADGASVVIKRDATKEEAEKAVYVLEFKAEGQETQKFETLHFETVNINLLSVDAMSGATPIEFPR